MDHVTSRVLAYLGSAVALIAFALAGECAAAETGAKAKTAKAAKSTFDATACLGCHTPIKELHTSGKHKTVGCDTCHDGTALHLADASKRPTTKTDLANCGSCHQNQYQSFAQMNWKRPARFEKKQLSGPAPDPSYDLLMSPHGFTKEVERLMVCADLVITKPGGLTSSECLAMGLPMIVNSPILG